MAENICEELSAMQNILRYNFFYQICNKELELPFSVQTTAFHKGILIQRQSMCNG